MTFLARALVALSPLAFLGMLSVASRPQGALRVAYYQPVKDWKTTLCIDTFGEVVLYPGSLRLRGTLTPATYSVCLESTRDSEQIAEALDTVAALHRFGALAP